MGKLIDLTGQKFGYLTVIERDKDKQDKEVNWKCRCICGNIISTRGTSLRKGFTKSCGCQKGSITKEKLSDDLTNKIFGELKVLSLDTNNSNKGAYWLCQCSCGNIKSIAAASLKNGKTKSCGCLNQRLRNERIIDLNRNLEDLSNQRFTKLFVKRLATEEEKINRPMGNRYWFCECDCGNTHIVSTSDLKSGKVKFCGCLLSLGEEIISKILRDNNIPFKTQYTFSDLRGSNNHLYRFDFAIFNEKGLEYLIEFDGIQHYKENQQFKNDSEAFLKIQERDRNKNAYCIEKSIPLIRIPYTHLSNLIIDDLILSKTTYLWKE